MRAKKRTSERPAVGCAASPVTSKASVPPWLRDRSNVRPAEVKREGFEECNKGEPGFHAFEGVGRRQ